MLSTVSLPRKLVFWGLRPLGTFLGGEEGGLAVNKGLMLRLPPAMAAWLKAAAGEKGVTQQELIRSLIEKEQKAPKIKAMFEKKFLDNKKEEV